MSGKMQYRPLGRTGIMVSAVGLGAITGAGGFQGASEIINTAVDLGVNFIDTSRAYAKSEERIGPVLKERPERVYVCTKTHLRDKQGAAREVRESLELLQRDTIDIYMLHDVSGEQAWETVRRPDGALQALKEAKAEGKIAHLGMSSHSLDTAAKALRSGDFEVLEMAFSAVENSKQHMDTIKLAGELGVGVVVMKPLSGGNLSNTDLAIRYVLQHDVACAIAGVRKPEEAGQNARAGWNTDPLTKEEEKVLFDEAATLGQTFCRRCGYCLPCTVGIDIPLTFTLDTQARAAVKRGETRILEIIRKQYAMVPVKGDACVEDGVCEERCPYKLPIREMLKAAMERFQG